MCSGLCPYASAVEPSATECPSDNVVEIWNGDACSFANVVTTCTSLGSTLISLHVALTCDIHIKADASSTYAAVSTALQSLKDAGYHLKVGFINSAGT
jgi:biopolymer transport protein ExbD